MESNFEKGEKLAYQELGRFLATFEQSVFAIKESISHILLDNGLSNKIYADIVLARLTAEPILSIFHSMLPYYFDSEIEKLANNIVREFRKFCEVRNIIVHCYWIVGVGVEDFNDVSLIGIKEKISSAGLANYNLNLEIVEMKKLNEMGSEFLEICSGFSSRLKRNDVNFDKIIEDLKKVKFGPFIDHFNKVD